MKDFIAKRTAKGEPKKKDNDEIANEIAKFEDKVDGITKNVDDIENSVNNKKERFASMDLPKKT